MINNIKMEQLNIFDFISESEFKVKPIQKKAKEIKPKTTKQFDIDSFKEKIKKRDEFLKKYAFLYCVSRSKTQIMFAMKYEDASAFCQEPCTKGTFYDGNGCICLQVFIITL